ncbi:MAG: S41 family peptidase [Defluviitaleaceae bacterium]|nr:S41 family peptidase [Defluviitaleaceae bacterium]
MMIRKFFTNLQEKRRERRAKRAARTPFEKLKRRYRVFQVGFFLLLAVLGFTVYTNYDYWVFKLLLANNYVFTDALDEFYSLHIREENRRSFHRDFDRVVISVVTGELAAINNDRHTYLYSPQAITRAREFDRAVGRTTNIEPLSDDTVLLFIPNISQATRQFVFDNKDELAQYTNLVLDLRGNHGGWLADAYRIADLFVPNGAVLSYHHTRMSFFSQTITSDNDPFFNFENIIILQDRRTASAAEGLIMALNEHLPETTTIGQTTFGKGTGQVTIPLTGGYAVRATVLQVLGPQGQCIHAVGVPPDIALPYYINLVEAALEMIYYSLD